MSKWQRKFRWTFALVTWLVLMMTAVVMAEPTVTISKDEVYPRDKFAATQIFRHDGVVKGDLFAWAQTIAVNGTVVGDLIGGAESIALLGDVLGDARIAGGSVTLSGHVGKNVNAVAGTISMGKKAVIGGNIHAFAGELKLDGQVKGYTHLGGGKIVLAGEFFGDVDINTDFIDHEDEDDEGDDAKLVVLPSAIVHGKLRFAGDAVDVQKGAQIGKLEWIKTKIKSEDQLKRGLDGALIRFVRLFFTTTIFLLLGLLLLKRFSNFFGRVGGYIRENPFNALGFGLLAMLSMVVSAVVFVILMIMAILISPIFGLVFGAIALAGYLLIFFLAPLPVALWLGDRLFKTNPNPMYRFGLGLVILNFGLFLLSLLAKVPVAGGIFALAAFVVGFAMICIGAGSIIRIALSKPRPGEDGAV